MALTIDELAAAAGVTSRSIRSFQTQGLLDHPALRGRTGLYDVDHLERLRAILRLQRQGFSLQSLAILFDAHSRRVPLAAVLGLAGPTSAALDDTDTDSAELYGFSDLQSASGRRGAGRRGTALLSVVPTTLWEQTEAS